MLELCNRIADGEDFDGVCGCAYRKGDEVRINKPRPFISKLDELPFPARDLLKLESYVGRPNPAGLKAFGGSTNIITSRGCPHNCTFCSVHLGMGKKPRFRSIDNVVGETRECIKKFDIKNFRIVDSTFTLSRKRVIDFCRRVKELGIVWACDARVDEVDRKLFAVMYDAGCRKISFGVESGSPRILELMRKGITVEQVERAFGFAHKAGLTTEAFFIIGSHPTETKKDIEMSYSLAKKIKTLYPVFAINIPYPGTEVYKIFNEKKCITDRDWNNYAEYNIIPGVETGFLSRQQLMPVIKTDSHTPEELWRLQKKLIRRHYLSPQFIGSRIKSIKSLGDVKYYLTSGINLLKHMFGIHTVNEIN